MHVYMQTSTRESGWEKVGADGGPTASRRKIIDLVIALLLLEEEGDKQFLPVQLLHVRAILTFTQFF